jgi:hypothetical protein
MSGGGSIVDLHGQFLDLSYRSPPKIRMGDEVRLSDLEPLLVCQACGLKGAEVRADFNWASKQNKTFTSFVWTFIAALGKRVRNFPLRK